MRLILLAAIAAVPLAAQESSRPPLAPDSVLTAGVRHAGFADWRKAVAAHGRASTSFLVNGARYQVLVLSPMAQDALEPDSLIVKTSRGCKGALDLTEEMIEGGAQLRPWDRFDAATRERPVVALSILPVEPSRFDCRSGALARFSAASRGALYGRFTAFSERTDVARAEVRRGGILEPAVLSGRAPVTKFDVGRSTQDGTQMVRLFIEAEALAPDADGVVPTIEVHVWNGVDEEPEILPLPEPVLRAVWQQLLPWRARLLATEGRPEREPWRPELRQPTDSVLRFAHERYAAGDFATAGGAALDRLMYLPRPPRREIRDAMLLAAATFTAYGEDAASQALVSDVMEAYPCLTLDPAAPSSMRDQSELAREPARCTSIPLAVIALRSVVPGWGQATGPTRRKMALAVAATTGGSYLLASVLRKSALKHYAKYEAYVGNSEPPADALYESAQTARGRANTLTVVATALWTFAAVEAVLAEKDHKDKLAEMRELGRSRRTVRIAPAAAPNGNGIGLALSVSFR